MINPLQPITPDDLIATLRANNGFVFKVETLGRMGAKYTALLPKERVISVLMFDALDRAGVLTKVSEMTKAGKTTHTYRIV